MKKIFLSVVAAVSALSAFAQADTAFAKETASRKFRTEAGRFGVEAGINLKDGFSVNGGLINANYTLSENLAVRLAFGLDVNRKYQHDIVDVEEEVLGVTVSGEEDTKDVNMRTQFSVLPGIVYSFKGTDRFEPYVGAELAFGFDKTRTKEVEDITDNNNSANSYNTKTVKTNTDLFFGANGFTGFNFFLCKDLYVGAELNFGFKTYPDRITNVDIEDSRVDETEDADDDNTHFKHETQINLNFTPTIRLGWKF